MPSLPSPAISWAKSDAFLFAFPLVLADSSACFLFALSIATSATMTRNMAAATPSRYRGRLLTRRTPHFCCTWLGDAEGDMGLLILVSPECPGARRGDAPLISLIGKIS